MIENKSNRIRPASPAHALASADQHNHVTPFALAHALYHSPAGLNSQPGALCPVTHESPLMNLRGSALRVWDFGFPSAFAPSTFQLIVISPFGSASKAGVIQG